MMTKKITGQLDDDEEDNRMLRVRLVTGGMTTHHCAAECSCVRPSSRAIHGKQQSSVITIVNKHKNKYDQSSLVALVASAAAGRQGVALAVTSEQRAMVFYFTGQRK